MISPIIEEVDENTRTESQNIVLGFLIAFFLLNIIDVVEGKIENNDLLITIILIGFQIILIFGVYYNVKNIHYGLYAFIIFNIIVDLILMEFYFSIMSSVVYYETQIYDIAITSMAILLVDIVISLVFIVFTKKYATELNTR